MTVELSASIINGRFKVTERPMAAPGKCAVCGAVDRAVVDFDLTLDYYGAVLICIECWKSANEVIALVMGTGELAAKQTVPLLNYLDTEGINEYVRGALDSVNRLNVILGLHDLDVPKTEPEQLELIEGLSDTVTGKPEQSDEPVISEGPASVPADNSAGQPTIPFDF